MSNYIDADLLRKEIERRKEKWLAESRLIKKGKDKAMYAAGKSSGYTEFLSIIDSLQQEQEEPDSEKFTEEFDNYFLPRNREQNGRWGFADIFNLARHFAEWQKQQMLKDAVEGEVCGRVYDHINVRFADGVCKHLEPKNISHIPADVSEYNVGDKVSIVVLKAEEE